MSTITSILREFIPIIAICFLPGLLINIWLSSKFADCATQKNQNMVSAFVLCFLFGIIGYLYVIALPDRGGSSSVGTTCASVSTSLTTPTTSSETKMPLSKEDMRYICLSVEEFPTTQEGRCTMCAKQAMLTFCKMKNEIGTREFFICHECRTKFKMNIKH